MLLLGLPILTRHHRPRRNEGVRRNSGPFLSLPKFLEVGLALLMIGASLAFGGVQPLTYSILILVVFFLLLLLVWKQLRRGSVRLPTPIWPWIFATVVVLQILPLPSELVGILSPARTAEPLPFGDEPAWMTVTIYPRETVLALFKFLAYLAGFTLAASLFDSSHRRSFLIRGLLFLGVFQALYGMYQYLTGSNRIFWYVNSKGWGAGTYINHNHYAGLLEMITPFAVSYVLYAVEKGLAAQGRPGGGRGSGSSESAWFQVACYSGVLLILFLGILCSYSRAGILAATFSVLFIFLLAQVKVRRKAWLVVTLAVVVAMVGYGLLVGLGPVVARFEAVKDPNALPWTGRLFIWSDAWRLIQDYPLLGTGLGTFAIAFRRYQTELLESFVDHAHNDYVEFICDTGFLGASLLFLPIAYLLVRMVASFLNDQRGYRRAVKLGCIGSTVAMLLHSFADFNLQLPANALIFAVVLGIGYKATFLERDSEPAPPDERRQAAIGSNRA